MYLKEIIISGFKSFADRTRLDLSQGVTAVVGPNGCGKSNIVDSIRWVLGEQSAKALRGNSMQDVIFEGTDKRKALPTCEVILTFTDCEDELGTLFNEVAVSRRVTRDGSSDYYINGKVSRLKDIQRLFANTGVGRVSYSFMLQGQIDQILSTNPGERRIIFEEAAGITLYKAQRKEALNKLALVDTNLVRVTDVIEEVSRQIGSLKRQASKALRYQRIKHRLTHLDLAFNAHHYVILSESIEFLAKDAAKLREKVEALTGCFEQDEAKLLEKKIERTEVMQKLEDLQLRVYNIRTEKDRANNQSQIDSLRYKDLESRISDFDKEIRDLEKQKFDLELKAKRESEKKHLQLTLIDDSDHVFQQRDNELTVAEEKLRNLVVEFQKRRQNIVAVENKITRSRSQSTTLEVDLKTFQVKCSSLKDNISNLSEEGVLLKNGLSEIQRTLKRLRQEKESLDVSVETAQSTSRALFKQSRSLLESIQDQDRSIAQKTTQLNLLEGLQANLEGFGEGAKAILGNKLNELAPKESISVISKEINVEDAYSTALQILLGNALEAIYIGKPEKALSVIGKLDADFLGRVCLQVDLAPMTSSKKIDLPVDIIAAQSVVKVGSNKLKEPVDRLLRNCYIADSLDQFVKFWQAHPNFNFLYVATLAGESIDCRGLIYGGRTSGKKPSNILKRESEIRRLSKEIYVERAALNKSRDQAKLIDERLTASEAFEDEQLKQQSELASEVSSLISDERNQSQKIDYNARNQADYEEEISRLLARHGGLVSELEVAQTELTKAERNLKDEREKLSNTETAIELARSQRDERREALSDVRFELAEKKQRLDLVDRAIADAELETANVEQQILRRNQEIDSINERISLLKLSSSNELKKSEELKKTFIVASEELENDRQNFKNIDVLINEIDSELSCRRNENRKFEQELNKLEIRLAEERAKLSFAEASSQNDYQVDLSKVDWKAKLWEADVEFEKRVNLDELDYPDQLSARPKQELRDPTQEELAEMDATQWSRIEEEVMELRERIANMGSVNLESINEYSDLKERYDFLKNQSEDLWNSKNKLLRTIDEINQTSQSLFSETFEKVRMNFAHTYKKISGGGESDLVLVDSEDPLESGIDIIARPPGTRLKNVTLLSGGQRTMTAVALLFAIYMVKPSPFCVLDEIDAALDDANIGRFCEILSGFTDRSQFLIITHNKRTISNADTVFGVTMPEKGVSSMVSMRFNRTV